MYVSSVKISHLRTFRAATIALSTPEPDDSASHGEGRNVTLIVGDNGAGKTTLLRAIALGALAPVLVSGSGYVPYSMVRRSPGATRKPATIAAQLSLHEQDGAPAGKPRKVYPKLSILPTAGLVDRFAPIKEPAWAAEMWSDRSDAFLLVAYGSNRAVDTSTSTNPAQRSKTRILRYDRVSTLFEEGSTLVALDSWLPQVIKDNPGRAKQVFTLVDKLLAPHGTIVPPSKAELAQGAPIFFDVGGGKLTFAALSDGFRAYIGWIGDLLYHLCMGAPKGRRLDEGRGVVLVDEIDLHLHPEWQRHVIGTVASALPNMQLVLTTHSPLLVGSVARERVRVITTVEDGKERARESRAEVAKDESYGLSADQILTSGHFGLHTTRVEAFAQRLVRQAAKARSGDPGAGLAFMEMLTLGGAGERSVSGTKVRARFPEGTREMMWIRLSEKDLHAKIEATSKGWLADAAIRRGVALKKQRVDEGEGTWSKIKAVYIVAQHHRCIYCERAMAQTTLGQVEGDAIDYDVEHFRPKNRVRSWPPAKVKQRRPTIDYLDSVRDGAAGGYPGLAFDPLNYAVSCKVCNSTLKADYFPIAGQPHAKGRTKKDLDAKELPFLLQPFGDHGDNPAKLLAFNGIVPIPRARSKKSAPHLRARVVIDFFELDTRADLLMARAAVIRLLCLDLEGTTKGTKAKRTEARARVDRATTKGPHASCALAFAELYARDRALAKKWLAAIDSFSASLDATTYAALL